MRFTDKNLKIYAVGGPCTSYELAVQDPTEVTFCGPDINTLRWLREIFETEGLTVTCLSNSAYAIFLHGLIDPATNLTIGFCLVGKEFEAFMESPTLENFKWLNHVCQKQGENHDEISFSFPGE